MTKQNTGRRGGFWKGLGLFFVGMLVLTAVLCALLWQALKKYGGGMLNNFGSHYIDQLLYFSGETVKKVFCRLQCVATLGDAEDVVRIVMETEKGAVLDVDINQAAAIYPEPLLIHGKYGAARLEKDSEGKEVLHVRWYDPRELPSA